MDQRPSLRHGICQEYRFSGLIDFSQPGPVLQSQAAPFDEKGKEKAKAERTDLAAGPTHHQTFLDVLTQGPSDQELRDIELAIKLSLDDRDDAEAKKASAAKAKSSSDGASSSKVDFYFSSDL